jgi:hypothetical protein
VFSQVVFSVVNINKRNHANNVNSEIKNSERTLQRW